MNCQLCQKESDAYREGTLSVDARTQVDLHLQHCTTCAEFYYLLAIVERVIEQEKLVDHDAFLETRIMDLIENPKEATYKTLIPFSGVLRPVLITTTLAAAVFAGVLIGNIYKPSMKLSSKPVELALIDDMAIESVNILSNE